MIIMHVISFIL